MKAQKYIIPFVVTSAAILQEVSGTAIDWTTAMYWTNYGIDANQAAAIKNNADDYKAFSWWNSTTGKPYAATVEVGKTISSTDKLVFNQSYVKSGTKSNYLNTSTSITSSDVLFTGFSGTFQLHGSSGSGKWSMNSLTLDNPSAAVIQFDQGSDYGNLALNVENNLTITGGTTSTALLQTILGGYVTLTSGATTVTSKGLRSLYIGGDLDISGRAFVLINTLDKTCAGQAFTVENYNAASTQIAGIVKMSVSEGGVPMLVLSRRNYAVNSNSITSVGGISGSAGTIKAGGTNDQGITALVFKNTTTLQSYSGALQDGDSTAMSLNLVMMGSSGSVQKANGYTNSFTGGIEIISGTLAVYNSVNSGDISMYSTLTEGVPDGKLWITKSARNDTPTLLAGDIYWKSGSLVVENTTAGTSLLSLTGTMHDDGIVAGSLFIEFNSDVFSLDGDSEFHLVSWDNINNKTTLKASDFTATGSLINDIRGIYDTAFSIRNDGLWVSFASVPEPSSVAVFIGFFALALTLAIRRRS